MKTNFSEAVSSRPVSLFQYAVVLTVLLVLVFDGMDGQSLGLVVPTILKEWRIERAAFGWALSASIFGMGLGALAGGWLGDRIGRLRSLFVSVLIFGCATIAASRVGDVSALTVLRFIGGLGFGAAGPNALALATEWMPARLRTYVIALLSVGTPAGGTIAAAVAPFLLADYGWRGLFLTFGVASLAVGVLALLVVRESPSYYLAKGRSDEANAVARRVLGDGMELVPEQVGAVAGGPVVGVFDRSTVRLTLGASLAFSALTAVVYAINYWGTELFTSHGLSQTQAIGVIFWGGIVSVLGALLSGWTVRAFGSRATILACSLVTFAVTLALGAAIEQGGSSVTLVTVLACAIGGVGSLGIATLYSLITLGYPVSCRSTGIGLGMMMGRAGGILMTFYGGSLLDLGGQSVVPFFAVMAVCALLVSLSAWIVDRHVAPPRKR
ncbi:MAG: MFS transporter [Candidatus Andeanibacterium colombiense]|uniref:MFS transporter n=1 Tax=Candidatus Andeanibacterium colombiense TaxID=3121345 RepID=A0AAJ5X3Z2_9SPHN|nr:MAG: MFS transporter [Sphingomonadaceae bacterium]